MMFHNVIVELDGSGLACPSFSFNIQNNLSEVAIAGLQKWASKQLQNGPQIAKASFNYYPSVAYDQLFDHIFQCHTGNVSSIMHPFKLAFAGITGMFYLDSYSMRTIPNSPMECSASMTCYFPLTGSLSSLNPDSYSATGDYIPHADSTLFYSGNQEVNVNVNSIGYSMSLSYAPIYIISSKYPYQVLLTHGEQSISLGFSQESKYSDPTFTGRYLSEFLGSEFDTIRYYSFNKIIDNEIGGQAVFYKDFSLSGFQVASINPSVSVGSELEFNVTATKFY